MDGGSLWGPERPDTSGLQTHIHLVQSHFSWALYFFFIELLNFSVNNLNPRVHILCEMAPTRTTERFPSILVNLCISTAHDSFSWWLNWLESATSLFKMGGLHLFCTCCHLMAYIFGWSPATCTQFGTLYVGSDFYHTLTQPLCDKMLSLLSLPYVWKLLFKKSSRRRKKPRYLYFF